MGEKENSMNGLEYFKEMMEKSKAEREKREEEQRAESLLETVGVYRRLWREIRAGLLEEGVPEELIDEVTLSFIRLAANNG